MPGKVNNPIELIRITLGYSDIHDRMHMDGKTSDGSCIRLWVTQRLMRQVASHFAKANDKAIPLDESTVQEKHHVPDSTGEHESVVCNSNDPDFLVESIDITQRQHDTMLLLKGQRGTQSAMFCLPKANTGMWVDGLARCFELANWPPVSELSPALEDYRSSSVTIH